MLSCSVFPSDAHLRRIKLTHGYSFVFSEIIVYAYLPNIQNDLKRVFSLLESDVEEHSSPFHCQEQNSVPQGFESTTHELWLPIKEISGLEKKLQGIGGSIFLAKFNFLFSWVQSLSHVRRFAALWTVARQASLSITNSRSSLKPMSIELVMPSNHLIHCRAPSPPAPNPSQHQGLFQWVSSSHVVAKVLEFQLQHQSFQWTLRADLL